MLNSSSGLLIKESAHLNITCQRCNSTFTPTESQSEMLFNMASRGQQLAMLACPSCQQSFPLNPTTLQMPAKNAEQPLPCRACADGFVSLIQDGEKKYWGCGSCGNVWQNKPT